MCMQVHIHVREDLNVKTCIYRCEYFLVTALALVSVMCMLSNSEGF